MGTQRLEAVLLGIGSTLAIVGYLLLESLIPTAAWVGFAGSYFLAGLLHGVFQSVKGSDATSFRYGLVVALISVFLPASIYLSHILATNPELRLADALFDLLQAPVLAPLTVAFITPFGIAKDRRETSITALILILPYLVAIFHFLSMPGFFDAPFIIAYHAVLLLAGAIAGLPLYLYGRGLE